MIEIGVVGFREETRTTITLTKRNSKTRGREAVRPPAGAVAATSMRMMCHRRAAVCQVGLAHVVARRLRVAAPEARRSQNPTKRAAEVSWAASVLGCLGGGVARRQRDAVLGVHLSRSLAKGAVACLTGSARGCPQSAVLETGTKRQAGVALDSALGRRRLAVAHRQGADPAARRRTKRERAVGF
jgi:hypothetical protein